VVEFHLLSNYVLIDLSAAFDTINHIILHRLSSWFGFDGKIISWLTSYLSSWSFVASIKSISSAQSRLRQGVPQGSVLGPLLFILHTTPLSSRISDSSVGHHLFADDTQSLKKVNFEIYIADRKATTGIGKAFSAPLC